MSERGLSRIAFSEGALATHTHTHTERERERERCPGGVVAR